MKLIYSWTPREYKNFIKGAMLRDVGAWEREAANALWSAQVSNSRKKVTLKDLYDGDKARKEIITGTSKAPVKHLGRFRAAQEAMKKYRTQK